MNPSSSLCSPVSEQLDHFEAQFIFVLVFKNQGFWQQGLNHHVDVSFDLIFTFGVGVDGHVENYIASTLMPKLNFLVRHFPEHEECPFRAIEILRTVFND